MKIYFIRHGHSDHNAAFDIKQDDSVYRSFDYKYSHLTEKGVVQIKKVQLPEMSRVYSSPIIRCLETTRILVGNESIVHLHDGLMETQGPYPCNWRPDIDTFRSDRARYILNDVAVKYEPYSKYYTTDVTETQEEIKERAVNTITQIKNDCATMDNVLVVTHNDWLKAVFGRSFVNGEVHVVEY